MAAGEYVSVSSQADTEQADLAKEKLELETNPEFEREELAQIYVERGLEENLAREVAKQLMAKDALGSHARDELGMTEIGIAHPIQAALASAATFSIGAFLPLLVVYVTPFQFVLEAVSIFSLLFLVILGIIAAKVGGASIWKGALRVGFWGLFAMAATAYIGALFGTPVA